MQVSVDLSTITLGNAIQVTELFVLPMPPSNTHTCLAHVRLLHPYIVAERAKTVSLMSSNGVQKVFPM